MGRALVQQLVGEGWRVFAAARETERIPDGVYRSYQFDATNRSSLKDIAIDLAHETSGLDLWVYAVGGLQAEVLRKMSDGSWAEVLDSNLGGAFMAINQTIHLINEGGQAAFIGAYIDHLILPKMGAYAVAKAGLETLVDVLQKEQRKVNFTLVKPGAVDTPFWQNAPFKMPGNAKSPEAVAEAIVAQYQQGARGVLAL
jgi:NAD(P)-dependent dehydrogenase (short-subunit alcohol dehydrogenase family)